MKELISEFISEFRSNIAFYIVIVMLIAVTIFTTKFMTYRYIMTHLEIEQDEAYYFVTVFDNTDVYYK